MAEYVPTAPHCDKHNKTLAEGERCRQCTEEKRTAAIQVVAAQQGLTPSESVEIDAEMLKDIKADLAFAQSLRDKAEEGLGKPGESNWHGWNSAAKLIAEATKLKYRALEQKEKISARAHSRYLVEHEKDIKGLRRKGN